VKEVLKLGNMWKAENGDVKRRRGT